MHTIEQVAFFDSATIVAESPVSITNIHGSQLVVQVSGSATAFELQIKGSLDTTSPTVPLGCINTETFDVSHKITTTGVYAVAVDGMAYITAELKSVTGGNITAIAKVGV